jgi:hypothetical protein
VTPELDDFGFEMVMCVACGAEYDTDATLEALEDNRLDQEMEFDLTPDDE